MEGYLHPLYAESFSSIGTPLFLPNSKGWLIKRQIPGTNDCDAMGPYPLFFCENWDALAEDFEALKEEIISITLVICPKAEFPQNEFKNYFELFQPYKCHYFLDYAQPITKSISSGRRKDARRALREVRVDLQIAPNIDVEEWHSLYANLIEHHAIKGIRAFSFQAFEKQLAVPNTCYFRAYYDSKVIGGSIYYVQDGSAYYHLSALADQGYETDAAYALKWMAIKYFKDKVIRMSLGGGTAVDPDGDGSGLDRFKKGWSNSVQRSYLCGKILQPERYELLKKKYAANADWFPAYRSGDY